MRGALTNDGLIRIMSAEDTHAGFTGHLLNSLQKRGFGTVVVADHQKKLQRKAIEESLIFIFIISKLFLSCPFRLDKLVEIVEFISGRDGRRLFPVFHSVEISDVTGIYGQALAPYKDLEPKRFDNWSKALTKVTHFTGCHFQRGGDIYEYQCIEVIIEEVSKHVAYTIGLYPRVKEVILLLNSGSDDGVHVVGICGVPGIGKKTIARGIYDLIAGSKGFDACCFFDNIGGGNFIHLLQMLLSEMVGSDNIMFGNVEDGMSVIKCTLNQKKVFIIFQGINHPMLLKGVVELTKCFAFGSKFIITALDKCLLESHGIRIIYEVERLDRATALRLLCLKIFNSRNCSGRYATVVARAVNCASGHPLTLEVIGSSLCEKTIEECEAVLDRYETIPNEDSTQSMVRENTLLRLSEDILEENMDYGQRNAQPTSNDRSRNWDPIELEYHLCSSSATPCDVF